MKRTAILSGLLLFIGASVHAQDTSYFWVGGQPGYSGQIILDSPSSSDGTLSDVVSITITDPDGTFSMDPSTAYLNDPTFTWNSCQITEMNIDWNTADGGVAGVAENYADTGLNFEGNYDGTSGNTYLDSTGSWQAPCPSPAPDAGSTFELFGAAFGGLALLRRFRLR